MGETSSWLSVLILMGYMTPNEANQVWARLSSQAIPSRPSEIARQVDHELTLIRGTNREFRGC